MRHTKFLVSAAAIALTGVGVVAQPAAAAPWVKGYVVGQYEYAFRYGGRSDFSRGAEIEPGVDCLHAPAFTSPMATIPRSRWRASVGAPSRRSITSPPRPAWTRSAPLF